MPLPKLDPLAVLKGLSNPAVPAGANPEDAASALSKLNATDQPQAQSLTDIYNLISGALDRDTQAQQQYGAAADQKIVDIGGQLQSLLQGNVQATQNIFGQGRDQIGGAYDQAAQNLQGLQGLQGNLSGRAAQLGLDPNVSTDPLLRLQGELGVLQGRNANSKADALANNEQLGSAMSGLAQERVGFAGQDTAQRRNDLNRDNLSALAGINSYASSKGTDVLSQLAQLSGSRGARLDDIITQLGTTRFNNSMDLANLNIKQQDSNTKQQAASTQAATAASTISKNEADTALKQIQAINEAKPNKGKAPAKGESALNYWFNENLKGPSGKQKHDYGFFKGGVERLIETAEAQEALWKKGIDPTTNERIQIQKGEKFEPPSAYQIILNAFQNELSNPKAKFDVETEKGKKNFPLSEAISAVRAYFGKQ